eukprot:1539736-Pyramimonas_sp.AAC.1
MTHFVLRGVVTAHPQVSHRIWIDDLSQQVRGSRAAVRTQLRDCILDTCSALACNQLKVSPKSVVVCTHLADA